MPSAGERYVPPTTWPNASAQEGLDAIAVGHTDDVACRLHGYVEYHFSIPPIDQISLLEFPRICRFRECLSFASDVYSSTELVAATKASRPALPLGSFVLGFVPPLHGL